MKQIYVRGRKAIQKNKYLFSYISLIFTNQWSVPIMALKQRLSLSLEIPSYRRPVHPVPITHANLFQPQQQLLCVTVTHTPATVYLISKQLGKCHSEMLLMLNWLDKCDQRTSINRSCGRKRLEIELRGGLVKQLHLHYSQWWSLYRWFNPMLLMILSACCNFDARVSTCVTILCFLRKDSATSEHHLNKVPILQFIFNLSMWGCSC